MLSTDVAVRREEGVWKVGNPGRNAANPSIGGHEQIALQVGSHVRACFVLDDPSNAIIMKPGIEIATSDPFLVPDELSSRRFMASGFGCSNPHFLGDKAHQPALSSGHQ